MTSPFTQLIVNFHGLNSALRRQRLPILERLEVTPAVMMVIGGLYRAKQPLTRIALAEALGVATTTLGRPIDQAVATEWILREQDPNNRRCIKLSLTSTGIEIAKQYRQQMTAVWQQALRGVKKEKVNDFISLLEKMSQQLEE